MQPIPTGVVRQNSVTTSRLDNLQHTGTLPSTSGPAPPVISHVVEPNPSSDLLPTTLLGCYLPHPRTTNPLPPSIPFQCVAAVAPVSSKTHSPARVDTRLGHVGGLRKAGESLVMDANHISGRQGPQSTHRIRGYVFPQRNNITPTRETWSQGHQTCNRTSRRHISAITLDH